MSCGLIVPPVVPPQRRTLLSAVRYRRPHRLPEPGCTVSMKQGAELVSDDVLHPARRCRHDADVGFRSPTWLQLPPALSELLEPGLAGLRCRPRCKVPDNPVHHRTRCNADPAQALVAAVRSYCKGAAVQMPRSRRRLNDAGGRSKSRRASDRLFAEPEAAGAASQKEPPCPLS